MNTVEHLLRRLQESWDDPAALAELGTELHYRNRLDHARAALERAVELDPTRADAWEQLSYCFFRSLDGESGRATLRRGIEATGADILRCALSHFATDEDEKGALLEALAETSSPGARMGYLGHELYGERGEETIAAMREMVEAHPEDEQVLGQWLWSVMGGRHRGLFDSDVAREEGLPVAERLIERNPDSMFGSWIKLQLLFAEKDHDAALAETARVLERFPDDETVMQLRGRALVEKGRLLEAVHWFSRAIGAKPSFVGARVELGKAYEQMGEPDLAEAVFREIPGANPDYAAGPMSLALFLGRQGRWEEGERIFVETWPTLPPMFQAGFRQNPVAKEMLEREAVKRVVETETSAEA